MKNRLRATHVRHSCKVKVCAGKKPFGFLVQSVVVASECTRAHTHNFKLCQCMFLMLMHISVEKLAMAFLLRRLNVQRCLETSIMAASIQPLHSDSYWLNAMPLYVWVCALSPFFHSSFSLCILSKSVRLVLHGKCIWLCVLSMEMPKPLSASHTSGTIPTFIYTFHKQQQQP